MEWLLLVATCLVLCGFGASEFQPCSEIIREMKFPCTCEVEIGPDNSPSVSVDCDRIVFPADVSSLPYGAPITAFSQRWTGHQTLPSQIFSSPELPLRSLDLSGNLLRKLGEKQLQKFQSSLVELRLADNILGDTLNPIFSSSEFRGLEHLQLLDLSGNGIKAIEEGILEGCRSLKELLLDRNSFTAIPSSSLNGPDALKVLSLRENRISVIENSAFASQPQLDDIDVSSNVISAIEGGAFSGLSRVVALRLGRNALTRFNSDVFQDASSLQVLDLSENFIAEFPSIALKDLAELRVLNLSSNLMQSLDNNDLSPFANLRSLDLSRNNIANVVPGTFLGLKQLRFLNMSVNSLRTIEDDAFEGLDSLEHLSLKDNNILLIPGSALGRLPKLKALDLDYNRVAAISGDILSSIAERVTSLVISKNVVRELPPSSFHNFKRIQHLDLNRNLISSLNFDAFLGLEPTLETLDVSQNHVTSIGGGGGSNNRLLFRRLRVLDLSDNYLSEVSVHAVGAFPVLKVLNISNNAHLVKLPSTLLPSLPGLEIFDCSHAGLKVLRQDLFGKSSKIREIRLNHNSLSEIRERTFANLPNLTYVDLSYNDIIQIHQAAFVNVMNIRKLLLKGNGLTAFRGEIFNTGTSLEVLDVSDNQLSYLFPSSFRIHPRLREVRAARNKFNFFSSELLASLQFLELVDLSGNDLKVVQELDFAKLPRLRSLLLAHNQIEVINEMAFHNSTQLQIVDLSYNKIDRLNERTFEGLVRLECLDLEGNLLSELPENIFERGRVQILENINLANNLFEVAPLKALQRQYFFVSSVDLSHNRLREVPTDASVMINIKTLDLSFNNLSGRAIRSILGEPKTIRELNLAGTGISELPKLETPFLHSLNLSHNNISRLSEEVFRRTTLLEVLDVADNNISDLTNTSQIWGNLKSLQVLNMSSNPIRVIAQKDFEGLTALRQLSLVSLRQCERIEKSAFKSIPNVAVLDLYDYPKLGYIDLQGLLQNLPNLERVNIESKDSAIGSSQLQPVLQPRLKELGLMGPRLHSVSAGTFSGIKGPEVTIKLVNTSLTSLPPALFFPVPRSSRIKLDVSGSQLSTVALPVLNILDDRRGDLEIHGLETNPIICNCNARAFRRWLPVHMTTIRCHGPEHFAGKLLVEIGDDELLCDFSTKQSSTASTASLPASSSSSSASHSTYRPPTKSTRFQPKTPEPEIIWSVAATEKASTTKTGQSSIQSVLNSDDTLIIGIVGGVVAFIAILIIVICIIRLRMSSNSNSSNYRRGGMPNPNAAVVMGTNSNCACSVKGGTPVYPMPPSYAASYATLPHKDGLRVPYHQGSPQPYFIAVPSDEKHYQ